MRLLIIDEQRARSGIAAVGDRRVSRRDPLDRHRLALVLVGVEIRKAEDAEVARVLVELRDDAVIILALFAIIDRKSVVSGKSVSVSVVLGGHRIIITHNKYANYGTPT